MKRQKGFTLIELLVVIAIIGILAAVLMVNLSGTRDKAKASAIKLEMGQVRTAMETAANGGSYDGFLGANDGTAEGTLVRDPDVVSLRTAILANGGTSAVAIDGTGWCLEYALPGGGSWCADSSGYSGPTADCDTTMDCATD